MGKIFVALPEAVSMTKKAIRARKREARKESKLTKTQKQVNKEKDRYIKMVLSVLSDEIRKYAKSGLNHASVRIYKFLDDSPMNVAEAKERLEKALSPKGYTLDECYCLGGTKFINDSLCIKVSWPEEVPPLEWDDSMYAYI